MMIDKIELKKQIGSKILNQRTTLKMTRQQLCEDERTLSQKQLARIEKGESLPSLEKLIFISERLSLKPSELVEIENISLPQRYLDLKYMLIRSSLYDDIQRLELISGFFQEIEKYYFENLPEDEQLQIRILKSRKIKDTPDRLDFADEIVQEYFGQIKNKTKYSENDLFILSMYLLHTFYNDYEADEFNHILNTLFLQSKCAVGSEALILNNTLHGASPNLIVNAQYKRIQDLANHSIDLMVRTSDFQKMPVAYMLQGKYYLFSQNDPITAKQKYVDGSQLARLHQDNFLADKILEEWEKDFNQSQLS